jgi:ABC-type transport system substrate-binding protein
MAQAAARGVSGAAGCGTRGAQTQQRKRAHARGAHTWQTRAAGSPDGESYAVQVQSMLRAVGVDLSLKPQQANVMFAPAAQNGILASGNFDLAFVSFDNTDDPNDRRSFACASIPPDGFNISRWCNLEYDRLTNDALLHTDRPTRKRDYSRASQILVDEEPELFVSWPKSIELVRPGVRIDDGAHNYALPYQFHLDR